MPRMAPTGPKLRPSSALVRATYDLLMADRWMVALLLGGAAASTAVMGGIMFPAWFFGHITPDPKGGGGLLGLAVYAAAMWAASFVFVLVSGAVVAAAQIRADGGRPTLRQAMAVAWSRRGPLAAWAATATIVGLLMNLLERFGVAGLAIRFLTGIGWAVATIFAVPLLISEGTMPLATVRRSARMVRDTFGPTVRSNVRMALPWIVAQVVAVLVAVSGGVCLVVGVQEHHLTLALVGALLAAVFGVAFFFTAAVSQALTAYLNTMLYRYATGQPIPGIDPGQLPPLRTAQ